MKLLIRILGGIVGMALIAILSALVIAFSPKLLQERSTQNIDEELGI